MNDRLDAQTTKREQRDIVKELIRSYLSDGGSATTQELATLFETYGATSDGHDYFPLWSEEPKRFRSLLRSVVKTMQGDKECKIQGKGRGREVRLTAAPAWARQHAAKLADAELKTRRRALRRLARGKDHFLPELLESLQTTLHRELRLPAVGPQERVAEFALAYRVVKNLVGEGLCERAIVDHPDGLGRVARLRLVRQATGDTNGKKKDTGASNRHGGANGVATSPASNGQTAPASPSASGNIIVSMIPVALLRPSPWNPNTMSDTVYAEFVSEVRRLGRLPKPIVVRKHGTKYQIVDGEHAWKAAQKCEFTEVPCEIVRADDFEAMRQTYKRNRHGKNDPVKLGRLFVGMLAERDLSRRDLAKEIDVSEGTVRNFALYAQAAEVRNRYAAKPGDGEPVSADELIAKLSVKQIRAYLDLPQDRRDEWLDRGGSLEEAEQIKGRNTEGRDGVQTAAQEAGEAVQDQPAELAPAQASANAAPERPQPAVPAPQANLQTALPHPTHDPLQVSHDAVMASICEMTMLSELRTAWDKADPPVRRKFLAERLAAEPGLAAFLRPILRSQP